MVDSEEDLHIATEFVTKLNKFLTTINSYSNFKCLNNSHFKVVKSSLEQLDAVLEQEVKEYLGKSIARKNKRAADKQTNKQQAQAMDEISP